MFDNPEIMRQLVNGRIADEHRGAAHRRLAGGSRVRVRRRSRNRIPGSSWFGRRDRLPPAPSTAHPCA